MNSALQADSLPSGPPGKPNFFHTHTVKSSARIYYTCVTHPKPPDFAAKISESLPCFRPPLVFPCFQDKIQRMRCPNRQTHPASIPLSLRSCSSTLAIHVVYCVFPQDVLSRLRAIASPPPTGNLSLFKAHPTSTPPLGPSPLFPALVAAAPSSVLLGKQVTVHRSDPSPPRAELLACSRGLNKGSINDQIHE